jgi:signal transduction histidine kinase
MIPHEIRPKQLRALLLLLVLVPLIPTALMLRFMFDALRAERMAARERQSAIYRPALVTVGASFQRQVAGLSEKVTPQQARDFFRERLDDAVVVRIVDAAGVTLAGEGTPGSEPIAQTSPDEWSLPWRVQLHLRSEAAVEESVREQWRLYAWIGGAAIVVIGGIAGAAGLAVSRQLQLHELKTTAVATVAHELRTPLASMRMLVETLREGRCPGEAQRREYLDLIARENERLSRLTENFLTLSRLEQGQQRLAIAPVEVRPLIEEVLRPLRVRLAAPGCHFTCEAPETLPAVAADRDALHTILTNLLDNALKYTGDEKRITLRVCAEEARVVFTVSDNGVGLSGDERRAVFAPFYQADRKLSRPQGGCGLGLSIVQRLVAQLGGRIRVQGEPGRGSTFIVTLPATAA